MNAVRSIVAGLLCLAGVAQGADLPVKYLAYVEATGSQYVDTGFVPNGNRSEERRVGKECRSRWSPYH